MLRARFLETRAGRQRGNKFSRVRDAPGDDAQAGVGKARLGRDAPRTGRSQELAGSRPSGGYPEASTRPFALVLG